MKLSVFTGAAILASTALAELDPIIIKVRFAQQLSVFDPTCSLTRLRLGLQILL